MIPDPPAAERVLAVPDLSLVVLVGASGSGKSTFAARHFGRYEVVSSDVCRGLVSNDENDQAATAAAFALLGQIVTARLTRGLLTVVDATSVQPSARKQLVDLARGCDVLPVAVVLDVPESVCVARNTDRADRDFGASVVRRQSDQLRRSLKGLGREGFRRVHVLRGVEEVDAVRFVREPLLGDRRDLAGPFDVIGDVHGCRAELEALLARLGWDLVRDDAGRPVDAVHPQGRTAVFLGDLVDRGPDSPGVLRLAMGMVAAGHAVAVCGNHEQKLTRALDGRDVSRSHGLETTLAQLDAQDEGFVAAVRAFTRDLVSHYVLDGGALVVAHAGLKEAYHGRASSRVRSFALYGDTTGETDEYGLPVRLPWAEDYRGAATVLYGHTPTPQAVWVNRTMCLDTGCVFGGHLSALRWPERELVDVPAEKVWYEPVRPFPVAGGPADGTPTLFGDQGASVHRGVKNCHDHEAGEGVGAAPSPSGRARPDGVLDIGDVLGRRVVQTRHGGRISVREEQAAAALEVMSRFALPPEQLLHLPATMAPAPTSRREGLLEHPEDAFAAYAADGVEQVVCEEKHMGSRALVLLRADPDEPAGPGRSPGSGGGAVHTRTGRSFFDAALTDQLLGRLRGAAGAAGLWDELGTRWLLLDAELLPWSAKADSLVRSQFAAVGAAAGAALPAAVEVLRAAAARFAGATPAAGEGPGGLGAGGDRAGEGPGGAAGQAVGALLARTQARVADTGAFTQAYRRYVWPTGVAQGRLDGVAVAPFSVLASEGAVHVGREQLWHLSVADRLADAAPDVVRRTGRVVVDVGDPVSVAAGVAWWEDLTAAGGEGMVVKPAAGGLVTASRGRRGLGADGEGPARTGDAASPAAVTPVAPGPRTATSTTPQDAASTGDPASTGDRPARLVQPGLKVRGAEYLRLVYGPEYTEPAKLARCKQRQLGHKRSLAVREHALGVESLERVVAGEPLWRVHEAVFAVLACESEPVDPRL